MLVTSRRFANEHGLLVLATIKTTATAGVPSRIMGIGPVPVTATALDRAGPRLDDVDLIELNEAFAAQSPAVLREWGKASRWCWSALPSGSRPLTRKG